MSKYKVFMHEDVARALSEPPNTKSGYVALGTTFTDGGQATLFFHDSASRLYLAMFDPRAVYDVPVVNGNGSEAKNIEMVVAFHLAEKRIMGDGARRAFAVRYDSMTPHPDRPFLYEIVGEAPNLGVDAMHAEVVNDGYLSSLNPIIRASVQRMVMHNIQAIHGILRAASADQHR